MKNILTIYLIIAWTGLFAQTNLGSPAIQSPSNKNIKNNNGYQVVDSLISNGITILDGNTGIGTNNPGFKLHVLGDAWLTNADSSAYIFFNTATNAITILSEDDSISTLFTLDKNSFDITQEDLLTWFIKNLTVDANGILGRNETDTVTTSFGIANLNNVGLFIHEPGGDLRYSAVVNPDIGFTVKTQSGGGAGRTAMRIDEISNTEIYGDTAHGVNIVTVFDQAEGDTIFRIGQTGDLQYYTNPCAGCVLTDVSGNGVALWEIPAWQKANDTTAFLNLLNDSVILISLPDKTILYMNGNSQNNYQFIQSNSEINCDTLTLSANVISLDGDFIFSSSASSILPELNNTGNIGSLSMMLDSVVTDNISANTIAISDTIAPASDTATLTNFPSGTAGNPTGFLEVEIPLGSGIIRKIPYW